VQKPPELGARLVFHGWATGLKAPGLFLILIFLFGKERRTEDEDEQENEDDHRRAVADIPPLGYCSNREVQIRSYCSQDKRS
jgi:hypothetical protein